MSVRAFIQFPRDTVDGSSTRVLSAVYLALKLRFVSVSPSVHSYNVLAVSTLPPDGVVSALRASILSALAGLCKEFY